LVTQEFVEGRRFLVKSLHWGRGHSRVVNVNCGAVIIPSPPRYVLVRADIFKQINSARPVDVLYMPSIVGAQRSLDADSKVRGDRKDEIPVIEISGELVVELGAVLCKTVIKRQAPDHPVAGFDQRRERIVIFDGRGQGASAQIRETMREVAV
jgi:hypothetical protein